MIDIDVAVEILQANGRQMHYRELTEQTLQRLGRAAEPEQVVALLTQINLDARFSYAGQGEWGLKSWMPVRPARKLPTITLMNKSVAYDDDAPKVSKRKKSPKDLEDDDGEADLTDEPLEDEEFVDLDGEDEPADDADWQE
ncbi:MAG: DNA-directed RNA polymerase subunit delta [Peptococcaceae bacterium]|nr:DNA-directed RNA polymerase subunit delta [Peptococcaceae bacterium]